MNALGLLLVGSIAHATAFAVLGIVAYLALRRWGPAAGALAAGSSLGIMAAVAVLVISPWPRWWTLGLNRPAESAPTMLGGEAARSSASPVVDGSATHDRPPEVPRIPAATPAPNLLALVIDELRRPSAAPTDRSWTWREWLALTVLAGAGLGLGRLGIGLLGIARLRARSRPVDDPELDDLLQLLRAELSCTRPVELRELDELTTPATIGWRRPVLLLPAEWRSWDDDERRAVLAHELAHVLRGDFAAGVAAQLALAFQFYHPLAHWLATRLRLEQELAADAWGARLSGGKSSYLATLARMALRRDGRAITWPARAFLPSHGTFVRRIEMLKNHGPIRHVTLSLTARVITVAAFVASGLLVAGLRGPLGDSTAMAQEQPAPGGAAAAPGSYNLAFVPDDTRLLIAVRPGNLLHRREIRSLLDWMFQGPVTMDKLPVKPEEIEQAVIFWGADANVSSSRRGPGPDIPSGLVLRTNKAQDWKAQINRFVAASLQPGLKLEEARHDGQTYYRFGGDLMVLGIFTPDDRTVVAAEEVVLRDLITDRNTTARHHWDDAWKRVAKGPLMIALDARWLRRQIAHSMPRGGPPDARILLDTFAPLYERAESYAASLQVNDQSVAINVVGGTTNPQNARDIAETAQAVLTLGKNALRGIKRDLNGERHGSEAQEWLFQSADSILAQAKVETTEGFVRLHADAPVDVAEGIRLVAPAVGTARAAARRAQSVNNLKQIGLAFHNYHSAMNHFPAAVNRGGKNKNIPYSWRVAILPYIEQQALYNQYNFDEPWDGPNNRKLIEKIPVVYAYPNPDGPPLSKGHTSYFVFTGPSTAVGAGGDPQIQNFTDGTSNTILTVEAKREIPWTKPEDIPFDPEQPLPEIGGYSPDGTNVGFADGSVRVLKKTVNPVVLKKLITRDGGEIVSSDQY
ncbi:MAG: DUF1559 family PulG-like putative transporter [Isosphaeraceae bacterium]